jgi:hypothetical protein
MGSIPLPALDVKAPQQPDLLSKFGQLQQLQNLRQQSQMQQQEAPLRMQALQQGVQSGQLDLQQKQITLKDQQAMNAAMQQWSQQPKQGTTGGSPMPNYDDLIDLARKNGASFSAIQGIQKSILDMKDKASSIAKNDAQAGTSNANTMKIKNGMLTDALTGVVNLPDDQLASGLLSTAQQLAAKGLLDPEHVQLAQQLAQSGNPAAIRQQLTTQISGLGGFTKLLDDAQKKVLLEQEKGKTDPTSPLYSPSQAAVAMGTAPGAAQIQAGEVKQAARKAGAEENARMPGEMALVQQRQAVSQGDPNAAAQLLVNGDATLSELRARGVTPDFIAKTLNAAHQISGGKYNAQEADANFRVAQSPANVAFFGSAKSLTDPGGTLDQLATVAKTLPSNQIPAFNSLADWEKAATGNGPLAHYASTALGVADDYAKVMGGGQGSDTSRLQALNLIKSNASPEARANAIDGIRGAVVSQTKSRIGNNPVLGRMYGDTAQAAQGGMVTVQIPGSPAGQIPAAALAKFKADHPNAQVQQ